MTRSRPWPGRISRRGSGSLSRQPFRTLLLAPPGSLEAGLEAAPDILVIDVAGDEGASEAAARLMPKLRRRPGCPRVYVRIGALATGGADAELGAVMRFAPDGIVLLEAAGLRDIEHLGAKLAVREAEHDLPDGATRIVVVAGDPSGVAALCRGPDVAAPRLAALACDLDRLARALGCGPEAPALAYAASVTVLAAAAADVPALVAIPALALEESLARALRGFRRDGFAGVILSDPAGVAAANEVFGRR